MARRPAAAARAARAESRAAVRRRISSDIGDSPSNAAVGAALRGDDGGVPAAVAPVPGCCGAPPCSSALSSAAARARATSTPLAAAPGGAPS
eukprot:1605-Pleurochrysis_carterae.AAC.1